MAKILDQLTYLTPDHERNSFRAWAARHFRDEMRDPLRRSDRHDGFFYERVNDAWEAWKCCGRDVVLENTRLRNLLAEISRHTISSPLIQIDEEPDHNPTTAAERMAAAARED